METFSIGYALLATQRALLETVTPELRAVVVDICKEEFSFYIRFYYDGVASEQLIDLWECAITEASADLGPDCSLDDGVERLDYPHPIPFRGRCAYLRKEPISLNQDFSQSPKIRVREIIDFEQKTGIFIDPVSWKKVDTSWGIIHNTQSERLIIPAKPPTYKIEVFPISYALLAVQRALLGIITPNLRAIIVDIQKDNPSLYIRFYYDEDISEEVLESWEYAITKSVADLGPDYLSDTKIEKLPYPQEIPFCGRYAYLRKEKQ